MISDDFYLFFLIYYIECQISMHVDWNILFSITSHTLCIKNTRFNIFPRNSSTDCMRSVLSLCVWFCFITIHDMRCLVTIMGSLSFPFSEDQFYYCVKCSFQISWVSFIIFLFRTKIRSCKEMSQTMEGNDSNDKQTESNTQHNHNERYGIICNMSYVKNILRFSRERRIDEALAFFNHLK